MPGAIGVAALPSEGGQVTLRGETFEMRGGILRSSRALSLDQQQTSDAFGFKWHQRETFESEAALANTRRWLVERYGDVDAYLPAQPFLLLDAGCGAALSAVQLFGGIRRMQYLGVDVSNAVDVAIERCAAVGMDAAFLQCDLQEIPLPPASVDVVFSEGVLHHTDSTEAALKRLVPLLRPGGLCLFYVYRKKGPVREFTDDYVRGALRALPPEDAWAAMMPLTRLGKALGDLNVEIDVPEDVRLLGIPAGRTTIQRLFYWHVCKAFYRPEYTIEEMNHINFDWYAPANAHRQSPEQVRAWCAEAGLRVEREVIEDAGITIVARRAGEQA